MHVELLETRKRKDDNKVSRKAFIYKETDFPTILGSERKKPIGKFHIWFSFK